MVKRVKIKEIVKNLLDFYIDTTVKVYTAKNKLGLQGVEFFNIKKEFNQGKIPDQIIKQIQNLYSNTDIGKSLSLFYYNYVKEGGKVYKDILNVKNLRGYIILDSIPVSDLFSFDYFKISRITNQSKEVLIELESKIKKQIKSKKEFFDFDWDNDIIILKDFYGNNILGNYVVLGLTLKDIQSFLACKNCKKGCDKL